MERVALLEPNLVGASEVGFARMALTHRDMWFGKRKDERVRDEEPLISGCCVVTPCMEQQFQLVVLQPVTKGESYQWNLEMDVTPGDLFHFMHKDM